MNVELRFKLNLKRVFYGFNVSINFSPDRRCKLFELHLILPFEFDKLLDIFVFLNLKSFFVYFMITVYVFLEFNKDRLYLSADHSVKFLNPQFRFESFTIKSFDFFI